MRFQCKTCPFDPDVLDNAIGGVWSDFGGGSSPKHPAANFNVNNKYLVAMIVLSYLNF